MSDLLPQAGGAPTGFTITGPPELPNPETRLPQQVAPTGFTILGPPEPPAPLDPSIPAMPVAPTGLGTMMAGPPAEAAAVPLQAPQDTGAGFFSGLASGGSAALREGARTLSGQAFTVDPNAPQEPVQRGWFNELGYGLGHSFPVIGAGLAGGAAGGAAGAAITGPAAPIGGTVGTIAGAGLGVGAMALAQDLAPTYAAAIARGMDHDAAVDYTWKHAAATGLASGATAYIPGPVKTVIGNILWQTFAAQPISGAATRTAVPLAMGEPTPTTEEYIRGLGQDIASGAAIAGGHAAGQRVVETVRPVPPPPPPTAGSPTDIIARAVQSPGGFATEMAGVPAPRPDVPTVSTEPTPGRPPEGVTPETPISTIFPPTRFAPTQTVSVPGAETGPRISPQTTETRPPSSSQAEPPQPVPPVAPASPSVEPRTAAAGPAGPAEPGPAPLAEPPSVEPAPAEPRPAAAPSGEPGGVVSPSPATPVVTPRGEPTGGEPATPEPRPAEPLSAEPTAAGGRAPGPPVGEAPAQRMGPAEPPREPQAAGAEAPRGEAQPGTPEPGRITTEPDHLDPSRSVAKNEAGEVIGKGATPEEATADAQRRGGAPYPEETPAPATEPVAPALAKRPVTKAEYEALQKRMFETDRQLSRAEENPATDPARLDVLRQRRDEARAAYENAQGPPTRAAYQPGQDSRARAEAGMAAEREHAAAIDRRIYAEGQAPTPEPKAAGKIFGMSGTRDVIRGADAQGNVWLGTGNTLVRAVRGERNPLERATAAAEKLKTATPRPVDPASISRVTTPKPNATYEPVTWERQVTDTNGNVLVIGVKADGTRIALQKPVYDALHAAAGGNGQLLAARGKADDGRVFAQTGGDKYTGRQDYTGVGMQIRLPSEEQARIWARGPEAPATETPATTPEPGRRTRRRDEPVTQAERLGPLFDERASPGEEIPPEPAVQVRDQELVPRTTEDTAAGPRQAGLEDTRNVVSAEPAPSEPPRRANPQIDRLIATRDRLAAQPNKTRADRQQLAQIERQLQRQLRQWALSRDTSTVAADATTNAGERRGGRILPFSGPPQTGRPRDFLDYKFNDGTSVYRSVFQEAGHDPDLAVNFPIARQTQILTQHLQRKFGFTGVEVVGPRGQDASRVDQRLARDAMLDLTRATQDMMSVLGHPVDAASFGGKVRLVFDPEGRVNYYGRYSADSSGRTIRVMTGANSFGHEWTHGLDHALAERLTGNPAQMNALLTQYGRTSNPVGLNVTDPVQAAFAKILNLMFFDKAALAARHIQLEGQAKAVDRQGNPTKAAINAQAQLAKMEAGGSQLRIQPSEFRRGSAQLRPADYWASAPEMLARAHEAYIAREMQQSGTDPRGVVMPDEAYIADTNRQLRLAYPKNQERMDIFQAFDELHHAMINEQVLGTGTPPGLANFGRSDPFYWPVTAPTAPGNPLTRAVRTEINAYKGFGRNLLASAPYDPNRPSHPLSLGTRVADGFRAVTYSSHGLMETIIDRAPSGAKPYLRQVLDRLATAPGEGRYTPENFEEAVKKRGREWTRRMGNIFETAGLNPNRMSAEDGLMLRHVLTEGNTRMPVDPADPSKGTVPVPNSIVSAAGNLRYLLDDIWKNVHNAGIDVGYAKNGYYPRLYDPYRVFADPAKFDQAARQLHRLMFDQEVGAPNNIDPGTLLEQWTGLTREQRQQAPTGLEPQIAQLRQNLTRQRRIEENPNPIPAETAELAQLKTDAAALAQSIHNPLGDHIAGLAASEWYARFMTGGVHDFDTMGPSGNFLKARSLPPEADLIMRDFMYADPRVALPHYIQSASRRIAFAERFGAHGEELTRLLDQARLTPGAFGPDIQKFESLAHLVTGRQNNRNQTDLQKYSTMIGAVGQMVLMPRAVWSSLAEPMSAAMSTGSARTGFKVFANQFGQLMRTASALERTQLADYLGVTTSAMHDSIMLSRMNADWGNQFAANKMLTQYYRVTGLTQLTNAQRVGAAAASNWLLTKLSQDYLNPGTGTRARNARDDATRWFNELGVTQGNHDAFARWMTSLGGLPAIDRLQSDPMGSVYGLAVRRMVDRIIQDPTKVDRPAIAAQPLTGLAVQLMNFNYQFQRNVLTPLWSRIEHAYGRAAGEAQQAGAGRLSATMQGAVAAGGAAGHAAAMVGTVLGAGLMVTALRQALFAPDQWAQHEEAGDLWDYLMGLTFQRSGLNGTLDPIIQVATHLRYNADLTSLMDGATVRWFAQNAQDVIQPYLRTNDSPNTNTIYYNQAKGAFNLVGVPLAATALTMLGSAGGPITRAAAGAALQFGTSPGTAGAFAEAAAGPKGTKLEPGGELGDLGDLGSLDSEDKTAAQDQGGLSGPWGLIDDIAVPAWRYSAPVLNRLSTPVKAGAAAAGLGYGVYDYLNKTEPYREQAR